MSTLTSISNFENIRAINNKLFNIENNAPLHRNIIFVYTPPKVGSTTLVTSLRMFLINSYYIIHIHDDVMLQYLTGTQNVSVNDIIQYNRDVGNTVYVINIYRSPIERKMSEYFEKLSIYHFNNTEEYIVNHPTQYTIARITDRFNCLFPHLGAGDHFFDKYGLDFSPTNNDNTYIPFDTVKGYLHQIINGVHYIQLRLKDASNWGSILSSIFNKEIHILTDHETICKPIGSLYNRFKDHYRLPANYIEIIRNCPYFQYYYSVEEQAEYLNKWTEKKSVASAFMGTYTNNEYAFYMRIGLENQYLPDIESEHYKDGGCICNSCSQKREKVCHLLKMGKYKDETIIHSHVVVECKDHKIKHIVKTCEKIRIFNRLQEEKQKNAKWREVSIRMSKIVGT